MSNETLAQTLGKIPLFHSMTADELKTVLAICKAVNFTKDQTIFNEGDPSHCMYILLTGNVEIATQKNGCLNHLGSCNIFGEIGLITQRTRSASAITRSDCKLLRIDHVEFNLLAGKHPRTSAILFRNISTNLANHLVRMNNAPLEYIPTTEPNTGAAGKGPQVIRSV